MATAHQTEKADKASKSSPARSAAQKTAQRRAAARKKAAEKIEVELAHPLNEGNPFTGEAHNPEDVIEVTLAEARHLLASGYLAADPENPDDVRRVLGLDRGDAEQLANAQGPGGGGE